MRISFPATFNETKALSVIAALQKLPCVEKVVAASAANLEFDATDFANAFAPSDSIPDAARRGLDVNPVPRPVFNASSQLPADVLPDRIVIRWKEQFVWNASSTGFLQRFADFHAAAGCQAIKQFQNGDHDMIEVVQFDPAKTSVLDQLLRYQGCPWIDWVQPDHVSQVTAKYPNDPLYTSGRQWNIDKISAPSAWDPNLGGTTGSPSVVLAIADSGANINHPDMQTNLWSGQNNGEIHNWVNNSTNVYDTNPRYHGSVISSIAGAQGGNGLYMTGVSWDTSLMHLKVVADNDTVDDADAMSAITYAFNHGATAINCSFGWQKVTNCETDGETGQTVCDPYIPPAWTSLLETAKTNNLLTICAAGNGTFLHTGGFNTDVDLFTPASVPTDNVISVANTDQNDALVFGSSYGQKTVDLAAPGDGTYGLRPTFDGNSLNLNNYYSGGGTSSAAPHVTGVAGLVKTKYPWEDYYGVRDRILMSTDTISMPTGKSLRTNGRLNAARALHRRTVVHNFSTRARVENGDSDFDHGLQHWSYGFREGLWNRHT